ncbi:MAG TPA: sensor histidine kinase [Actinomycetes bacterium]|jgi:signal transduction histidine kinase|nr:sensor histidine kinase [Actinomycetes bacterium]
MSERGAGRARLRALKPPAFDAALALAAAGLGLSLAAPLAARPVPKAAAVALYVLVLLHTLPLALRRRFPLAVLLVGLITAAGVVALGFLLLALGPTILVSVYTVASRCDRRVSLAGAAAVEAGAILVELLRPGLFGDAATLVTLAVVLGVVWLLGDSSRRRQAAVAAAEERAVQLERAREELASRAVAAERLRIARELHDVVAHSMSVIAVQSGTGRLVIDTQPDEARRALEAIEDTSRAALQEMRQLLEVLRQEDDSGGGLAPVPGLADLDPLVAQVVESGVAVEVRVEGTRSGVPAGVDLSAYRIVQEALTNVMKHAGPAKATVVVRYGDGEVALEVTDDGLGAAPVATGSGRTGLGTIGMRERAAVHGGDLEAGPRAGGGYRVAARLPFRGTGP